MSPKCSRYSKKCDAPTSWWNFLIIFAFLEPSYMIFIIRFHFWRYLDTFTLISKSVFEIWWIKTWPDPKKFIELKITFLMPVNHTKKFFNYCSYLDTFNFISNSVFEIWWIKTWPDPKKLIELKITFLMPVNHTKDFFNYCSYLDS